MTANTRPATLLTYLFGLLVLIVALGTRYYYLSEYQFLDSDASKVWQVQGRGVVVTPPNRTELDQLVDNLKKDGLAGFVAKTPLGPDKEEPTAHLSPLYPLMRAGIEKLAEDYKESISFSKGSAVRYVHLILGALTCLCYYLVAWRAFGQNQMLALVVGLATAFYPFWIINTGELEDGILASFLLAWSLSLGVYVGQKGGIVRSFLLGAVLAALALTRASLLPYAIVVQLWFFLRCRSVPNGSLSAIVCFAAFVGGLAPWGYHSFQRFNAPVPIVQSAWFHIWVGNNSKTDGGAYSFSMKSELAKRNADAKVNAELMKKLEETPVHDRYTLLADIVTTEIIANPSNTARRRLLAGMQFLFGTTVMNGPLYLSGDNPVLAPIWLHSALKLSLVAILLLALLGWRWSYGWKKQSAPLSLAVFWVPLPYLLSHADQLHSSRLPWDGVLIVLAAVGLLAMVPYFGSRLLAGEDASET